MSASAETNTPICRQNAIQKSQNELRSILDDLSDYYTAVGGGGISAIQATATNTYLVSLPQEERIDQISYELKTEADCRIIILSRTASTITMKRH